MKFTVIYNNETFNKESDNDLTIKDVLDEMNLSAQTIIAKKNGEVAIEETSVEDGDKIQFVQIIFGG